MLQNNRIRQKVNVALNRVIYAKATADMSSSSSISSSSSSY